MPRLDPASAACSPSSRLATGDLDLRSGGVAAVWGFLGLFAPRGIPLRLESDAILLRSRNFRLEVLRAWRENSRRTFFRSPRTRPSSARALASSPHRRPASALLLGGASPFRRYRAPSGSGTVPPADPLDSSTNRTKLRALGPALDWAPCGIPPG